MNKNYTKLVLSGGGSKGMAILGALHFHEEHGSLNNITDYWGTSIGSVICLLLNVGFTPFEIFHSFFVWDDLVHHTDYPDINYEDIKGEEGLCKIESFGRNLTHMLINKLGFSPTFNELYTITKKTINIIGTNVDKMEEVVFNIKNYPDTLVIDAIEISCDLPLIFTKKIFNNESYTDGGLVNDYPINLADNGVDDILGIHVKDDHTDSNWLYKLMYIPIRQLHKLRLSMVSDKCVNLEIIVCLISGNGITNLFPKKKVKLEIFSIGYKSAKKHFIDLLSQEITNNY